MYPHEESDDIPILQHIEYPPARSWSLESGLVCDRKTPDYLVMCLILFTLGQGGSEKVNARLKPPSRAQPLDE